MIQLITLLATGSRRRHTRLLSALGWAITALIALGCKRPFDRPRQEASPQPTPSAATVAAPLVRPVEATSSTIKGSAGCLRITNALPANATNFPALALVESLQEGRVTSCTGTFVGTNALLTAAHCLDPTQANNARPEGLKVLVAGRTLSPLRVFFPLWAGAAKLQISHDLAVLLLPEESAPAVVPIAVTAPTAGLKVTIAGYGSWIVGQETGSNNNQGLKLYSGSNNIAAISHGIILILGESGLANSGSPGEFSLTAAGDSGGPMIHDKALVGISSFGTTSALTEAGMAQYKGSPAPQASAASFLGDALALFGLVTSQEGVKDAISTGRQLGISGHVDLTADPYQSWLRSLPNLGVNLSFAPPRAQALSTATQEPPPEEAATKSPQPDPCL